MNYAAAVAVIRRYLDEKLPESTCCWNKHEAKIRSYSRWAANEIMARIMEEELRLPYHISGLEQRVPIEIAQEFVDEMGMLRKCASNRDQRDLYFQAEYIGEEILSLLYY